MAPSLEPRQSYRCRGYDSSDCYYYRSPWYDYGRWIVLAIVVVGAFLLFFLFACITARRRRKQGMRPFYGTGWVPGQQGPVGPTYNPNQPPQGGFQQQGPPVYSPPQQQGPGNESYNQYGAGNQGYFGGQQSGVELQQPSSTYQPQYGGNPVYAPPSGPPPGKN